MASIDTRTPVFSMIAKLQESKSDWTPEAMKIVAEEISRLIAENRTEEVHVYRDILRHECEMGRLSKDEHESMFFGTVPTSKIISK